MKRLSTIHATPTLLTISLTFGLAVAVALAEPMHTPTKMTMAEAESVGMSTEGLNRIDELMQKHVDAGDIQGGATIVVRRGKVVHFSTHGKMDVAKGRAMEPDAIYMMASSAKPVIGVATLMLVDEGLIGLHDPVSKYIPAFADMKVAVPVASADGGANEKSAKSKSKQKDKEWGKKEAVEHRLVALETPMTIHHLLTHTSGLTGGGVELSADDTLATFVPKLAEAPLAFQPGTRWMYGNWAIHVLLPRIIEIASETPFNEFMQERLFEPLAMDNSYFNLLPSDKYAQLVVLEDPADNEKAKGNVKGKAKGWGALSSSAEDFLHFEQMLLNGGELFGNRVLSPATVKMMGSNQVGDLFETAYEGEKAQRGMGFGYAVAVTLDPIAAGNYRGKGAFGWVGVAGTVSWTDPKNELVAVIMLQQPRVANFEKLVYEAIIE
jgi:CubicO group peptidase (beta-lactamase class C family)